MKQLILKPIDRPHWHLTDTQKMCLDLSLFIPKPKDELYMFVVDRKCTIQHAKQAAKQLFADPEAADYLSEREKWLYAEWFGAVEDEAVAHKHPKLSSEERNELAQGIINEILLTGKAIDATTMRMAIENGLNKAEEIAAEKPHVYVPLKCSICPYEYFCRTKGKSVCPRCKFRDFALEHGCEDFDYTELLRPKEDIAPLEHK